MEKNKCENVQQKRRVRQRKKLERTKMKETRYYEGKHITQNKCNKHETNWTKRKENSFKSDQSLISLKETELQT